MRRALASIAGGLRGLLVEQVRLAGVDARRASAYALALMVCAVVLGLLLVSAWWAAMAALVLWAVQLGWSPGAALLGTVPLHVGAAWFGATLLRDRMSAPVSAPVPVAPAVSVAAQAASTSNVELATAAINLAQTLVAAFTAARTSGGKPPPP